MKVLSSDLKQQLFNEFPQMLSSLIIVSPYISLWTIEQLLEKIQKYNEPVKITVITTFERNNFLNGASSLEAIQLLVKNDIQVYALNNLHTKAYIFNDSKCIVGSANFTRNGLLFNHELLIVLDQVHDSEPIVEYTHKLLDDIQKNGDWLITEDLIKIELDALQEISPRVDVEQVPTKFIWGANLDTQIQSQNIVLSIPAGDTIHLIESFHIHAHPVKKGYNYKETDFITFRRNKGGIMTNVYKIHQKFELDMEEWQDSINTLPISSVLKKNLSNYILNRWKGFGFEQTLTYKFYILEEHTILNNEPRPEINNTGNRYYDLKHLMDGNPYVYTL
ncbi:NgoFVII family restriction endonuclease (plasmid) [Psychrobacillus glaciei]|uniref:NgoFVII family restriction endonuclease n=1 Tax=Psychrobacillus glaciei TaxID=2283160 RepID=A0A5J6SY85_9BACI|nr:phospholipase D family protein [Psychrobacillus glaciei]QFG01298.1 NgoFVII family restriction endonuclease [Psychrobacillus glaciei]